MTNGKTENIGFLLFPGFPMACLTSMIEPLRAANEISGSEAFGWTLLSEDGHTVEASAKVNFDPDRSLAEAEGLDQMFLLSGPASTFANETASNGKLRRLARHGLCVGAVSGGIFPMARAGLLEGRRASVHWCYETAFRAEFPHIAAVEDVIVWDGPRITASGAAAAFDLALQMIEVRLGPDVSTEVACWFQHPMVRGQGISQRKPTEKSPSTNDMLPPLVRDAVAIFASHIEDPLKVEDVANAIGISVRQMERMFKQATGQTPLHYYRVMRMRAARELVMYSKDSMTQIAIAVGYTTSTPMIQNYQEVFGVHPEKDRERVNMFRVRDNRVVPMA